MPHCWPALWVGSTFVLSTQLSSEGPGRRRSHLVLGPAWPCSHGILLRDRSDEQAAAAAAGRQSRCVVKAVG